jgi:hypothetical protein
VTGTLAAAGSTLAVHGVHGWLLIIAIVVLLVAACAAFFAPAHRMVHVLLAVALAVAVFAFLWM